MYVNRSRLHGLQMYRGSSFTGKAARRGTPFYLLPSTSRTPTPLRCSANHRPTASPSASNSCCTMLQCVRMKHSWPPPILHVSARTPVSCSAIPFRLGLSLHHSDHSDHLGSWEHTGRDKPARELGSGLNSPSQSTLCERITWLPGP